MRILVAGAAAIALAAGGAYAAPGKGQGNDKQNNDRGAAQLERVQPDTGRANSVRQRAKPDTERRDNRTPGEPTARERGNGARAFLDRDRNRTLIAGCPPGLTRRNTDCVAPDQAGTSPVRNRRWNGYAYGGRVADRRHIRRRAAATGRLRRLQRALFLPRALRRYGGCLVPLFGRACVPDRSPNTAGRGCDRPAGLKVRP